MPATTNVGIPYPLPADPVRDGAAAMQSNAAWFQSHMPRAAESGGAMTGSAVGSVDSPKFVMYRVQQTTNQYGQVFVALYGFKSVYGAVSVHPVGGAAANPFGEVTVDDTTTSVSGLMLVARAANGAIMPNQAVYFYGLAFGYGDGYAQ